MFIREMRVHKLLVHGHFSESGLHSLLSRGSRCPHINLASASAQYLAPKPNCLVTYFGKEGSTTEGQVPIVKILI